MREIYISPQGSDEAEGSEARPKATAQAAISEAGWGCQVNALPGVYPDEALWVAGASSGLDRDQYGDTITAVRSTEKWGAVVRGSASHGLLVRDAPPVVLDGFCVTGTEGDGAKVIRSPRAVLRNLWIRHPGNQGVHVSTGSDASAVERCLLEGGFTNPQWNHGIYGRSQYRAEHCVVRHFGGYGIGGTQHLDAEGCLVWGNWGPGAYLVGGGSVTGCTFFSRFAPALRVVGGHVEAGGLLVVGDYPVRQALALVRRQATGLIAQQRLREALEDHAFDVRGGTLTLGSHVVCDSTYQAGIQPPGWLDAQSPARGVAEEEEVPAHDLFGRIRTDRDLGAFPFDPALTRESAKVVFYAGEPYLRSGMGPDFWRHPLDVPGVL